MRRTSLCQYVIAKTSKKEVVKAYMAGDKSIPRLAVEFNVAKSSVSKWVNEYKEECLYTTSTTTKSNEAKEID